MAYHIFIPDNSSENYVLNMYLGSASTVNYYWDSVGLKLNLPIISKLTQIAESEEDVALHSDNLIAFLDELKVFQKYWADESKKTELPERFMENISEIIEGVEMAVEKRLKVEIA